MPIVKFILAKDLVTEELIKEFEREGNWDIVTMIEANKKGTHGGILTYSSCVS